jgi:PAS domain S-box-containing protein
LTNDVQNDPWIDSKDWAREEGMISFAGYPLVIEDRTVGVIGMFSQNALAQSTLDDLSFIADGIAQGIERKRAEEMLRRSEAFLAEAQRISQICCFGWVPPTGEILLSTETFRIFEFEPGTDLTLDLAFERVHPEDRPFARQRLETAAREQNDFDYEHRLQMPDGRIKYVRVVGRPCRIGELQDPLFIATVSDVTKSKLTELSLRQSERYLAEAEALAHVGSWAWGVKGREAIYLSDEWYRIYGLDPKDGAPNFEARMEPIHPDDRSGVIGTIEQAMKDKAEYDLEFRVLSPSGTVKHVRAIGHPVLNAAGELVQFVGSSTDITERKHAEGQLRYTIDAIPALAWYGSPEGSVEFLNQRWLDYTGLSTEQAQGWGWQVAIHPDDVERAMRLFKESLDAKRPYEIEARFRRNDGEFRWFLFRGSPWCDASGRVVKWFGANADVEDLKRTEEALRASEQNFRLIVDNIPGLVFITNAEGKLEQVNRRVLEYLGKKVEELKGWAPNDAIHPDDLQKAIALWKDTVEMGDTHSADLRLRGADDTYHWFQSRGLTLRDSEDRILRCYYLLTDIDERKKTDEKLRRSEETLLEAQRLSHSSSWRLDTRTGAVVVSPEGRQIFGLTPDDDESVAEVYFSRFHPEDRKRAQELFERCVNEKTTLQSDHRIVLPDGSIKHLHVVGHPVFNESGDLAEYVGTTMDVSERRRADEERERLRQAQTDLAHISRVTTMGELTASLAHELNQPIAAALTDASTCLSWLKRDRPDLNEACEAASRIVKDTTRAGEIISRIRLMFQKGDQERALVDVNEVIGEVLALLRSEALRYSISIQINLGKGVPQVLGDRIQLQQVLMNLMVNSIEAMKEVDGIRELEINSQWTNNRHAMVSVCDTGIGLPQGTDNIFDAFFTTKAHGTGMGLRISRSIVESHGGRLWASHNAPRGAAFYLTLPAHSPTQ